MNEAVRDNRRADVRTIRATLKIVSAGDWFGTSRSFEGVRANQIRPGGEDMPLPAGHPCCEIRRSDAGFVIIADEAAGDVFLNGVPVSGARVVADGDQIGAGGALMLWREEVVHEASGNGRAAPREEGLSSVYQGLKKLFRRLGLFRTAEPIP